MACFVTPSQGVLGHFSEAPWGPERRYLGHISCSLSHMEMIFGTILKYSKADYMHKNWQHFIKKHKSYAVLTVSGLSLAGGRKGPSTTFQNSVIIARWERITWFLLRSLTHTLTHFTHFKFVEGCTHSCKIYPVFPSVEIISQQENVNSNALNDFSRFVSVMLHHEVG